MKESFDGLWFKLSWVIFFLPLVIQCKIVTVWASVDLSNHRLNFFRVDIEAYPNHLLDGRSQNTLPKLWKQLGQTLKPRPLDRNSSSGWKLYSLYSASLETS